MAFDPQPSTTAAGGYNRIQNRSGVSDLFQTPSEYGPSLAAFNTWKRYGIATSELRQKTTFGASSQFGTRERTGKAVPQGGQDPRHTGLNPISWEGADLAQRPEALAHLDRKQQLPPQEAPGAPTEMSASAVWKAAQAPAPTAQSLRLQEEEMQQTWAQLMRNGAVKPSAAMLLVVRPCHGGEGVDAGRRHVGRVASLPAWGSGGGRATSAAAVSCARRARGVRPRARRSQPSLPSRPTSLAQDQSFLPKQYAHDLMGEPPPKGNPLGSSMHTIGLNSQSNRPVKVSSKFTSQFNDPYL